jgi:hypothetical protein
MEIMLNVNLGYVNGNAILKWILNRVSEYGLILLSWTLVHRQTVVNTVKNFEGL